MESASVGVEAVVGPGVGGTEEEEDVHSVACAFLSKGKGSHEVCVVRVRRGKRWMERQRNKNERGCS